MFFKENKQKRVVYYIIDDLVEKTNIKKEKVFYYPLREDEVDIVQAYFLHKYRGTIQPDYIKDDKIYYKFFGWREI